MVGINEVRRSNATLHARNGSFVAVFVGGTSGIGEATAKELTKVIKKPTIHLIGRNAVAGSKILEELKSANPEGTFHFIQSDISLLKNVDEACSEIKQKEKAIDLLFLSTGHLATSKQNTKEGLENNHALRYYSRMRFVHNLLPLLSASETPARVVTVLGGGQEGKIEEDNLDLQKSWSFMKSTTYAATMNSLAVEHLATLHPSISFVHMFPGIVRTPLMNKTIGPIAGSIVGFLSRPMSISSEESGERNVFISTSAAYPPAVPREGNVGVPLVEGLKTSVASTGKVGGGSYILNYKGEDTTNEKVMSGYRAEEFPRKVWVHTLETFKKAFDPAQ
ncbi:putative short-chain dehydrogenases/reductase [Aspergillus alliaceus]|uniref:putative short-chain dehydrogenases/reductase n=1 Tax=Petromyces alliaceus TaxID=209559 RepID=UPI0012A43275|nr:putative short-chain dehydrogenases/reductase [Aspergillus alliaceus]KAB8235843.1 putative short-chain dehydrogenases/reductase [Aspergillus alliaceus]